MLPHGFSWPYAPEGRPAFPSAEQAHPQCPNEAGLGAADPRWTEWVAVVETAEATEGAADRSFRHSRVRNCVVGNLVVSRSVDADHAIAQQTPL